MCKCPRPGKLFSSVSGVVGCVTVLVKSVSIGLRRFVLPVWQIDVQGQRVFFFLTRTNRDVPRS